MSYQSFVCWGGRQRAKEGCCATCLCLTLGLLQTLAVHRNAAVAVQFLPLWWRRLVGVGSAAVGSLFVLLTTVPSESGGRRELRKMRAGLFYSDISEWLSGQQTNQSPPSLPDICFVLLCLILLIKPNSPFELVLELNSKTNQISMTHKQKQQLGGSCSKLLLETTEEDVNS